MKIRIRDRLFVSLVKLFDAIQGGILRNYPFFTFTASHAPQKFGAEVCCYRAFKEFLIAYRYVPAYKDFLRKTGWSCKGGPAGDIFKSLPVTDKPNYILPYNTEDRCLNGSFFHREVVIDESSGSTGIPYNWVRGQKERDIVKKFIGVYLQYSYGKGKYIILNTFSMGAWATGFNMALAAQSLGVVKSTGPDVDKILNTLQFFGTKYPYILNG